MAHTLTCPTGIAPLFDSCRLICVNDPNAVCGNPGSQCSNVITTSTELTTVEGDTTPSTTTTTSAGNVPSAPGKNLFLINN